MSLEQLKREMYARFKENAQLIENPIEHGDNSVDGSFYQVYRGNLESFLDDFAAKAYLQGIRDAKGCVPKEAHKHDNFFDPDTLDGNEDSTDFDFCGIDVSAFEAKCYNFARKETLEAITRLEENV